MDQVKQATITKPEEQKKPNLTPSIEERLRIIANIIIDRVIEDQRNGNLRFNTKPDK
jgi:hypothetical protein